MSIRESLATPPTHESIVVVAVELVNVAHPLPFAEFYIRAGTYLIASGPWLRPKQLP